MNRFLVSIITMAMIVLPAAANAEQCRDTGTGKFAKCGAPGAVLASKYVAKGKTTAKTTHTMAPAAATKPGFMSMMKPKATPAPAATPMTKTARCKTAKGKFVKCGTPGAIPA
jgi:hypothetical protein